MNNKAGKPVFDGPVDRILSEKIADHAQAGASAHNDAAFSGEKPFAPETESSGPCGSCCGGKMFSQPWHFVVAGVAGATILVVAGRFIFRLFSPSRHS
jgi:hypothetical protein